MAFNLPSLVPETHAILFDYMISLVETINGPQRQPLLYTMEKFDFIHHVAG